MSLHIERDQQSKSVPIGVHSQKTERPPLREQVVATRGQKKSIPTRLGSLIVLLAAVVAGSLVWSYSFFYEEPGQIEVGRLLQQLEERNASKVIAPVFIDAGELNTLLRESRVRWVASASSTFAQATGTQAVFYDGDYVNLEGVTYQPVSLSANPSDADIIAALEDRGYAWKITIPKYNNLELMGMAADGPNSSLHGMLKYDPVTDSLQTVVISTRRYLNEICVENGVEWYGEGVGEDGCAIESDVEVFVSSSTPLALIIAE